MSSERKEPAHDVLAAEMYGVPAGDPALHDEAHDVLAAEEFALPAADPAIHHAPVELPQDLTGAEEPRDVLAAEEFAMPAGPPHPLGRMEGPGRRGGARRVLAAGGLAFVALRWWRRRSQ